jgi:hypothetical protein
VFCAAPCPEDKEALALSGAVILTSGELGFELQPTRTQTPANASTREDFNQAIFNLLFELCSVRLPRPTLCLTIKG